MCDVKDCLQDNHNHVMLIGFIFITDRLNKTELRK